MPIAVTCPGCRKQFRVPDTAAGKRGRCPACQAVVAVPAPEPADYEVVGDDAPEYAVVADDPPVRRAGTDEPDVEEVGDDADRVRGKRERRAAPWRKVSAGLTISFVWSIVAPVFLVGIPVGAGVYGYFHPAVGLRKLLVLAVMGSFVVGVVAWFGMWLCAHVPAKSNARGLAFTALILRVVSDLLGVAGGYVEASAYSNKPLRPPAVTPAPKPPAKPVGPAKSAPPPAEEDRDEMPDADVPEPDLAEEDFDFDVPEKKSPREFAQEALNWFARLLGLVSLLVWYRFLVVTAEALRREDIAEHVKLLFKFSFAYAILVAFGACCVVPSVTLMAAAGPKSAGPAFLIVLTLFLLAAAGALALAVFNVVIHWQLMRAAADKAARILGEA